MSVREFYRYADCRCGFHDERSWPYLPAERRCPTCHGWLAVEPFREDFTAHVPYTSRKRFTPHFNSGLGMHIESIEHFEAMKKKFGVMDADVKEGSRCDGGVPASMPRDWLGTVKKAQDTVEKIEASADVAAEVAADEREFAADPITRVGFDEESAA